MFFADLQFHQLRDPAKPLFPAFELVFLHSYFSSFPKRRKRLSFAPRSGLLVALSIVSTKRRVTVLCFFFASISFKFFSLPTNLCPGIGFVLFVMCPWIMHRRILPFLMSSSPEKFLFTDECRPKLFVNSNGLNDGDPSSLSSQPTTTPSSPSPSSNPTIILAA